METKIEQCAVMMLTRARITRDELRSLRDRIVNGESATYDELDALAPENWGGYLTNTVEDTHDWAVMMRLKREDRAAHVLMGNVLYARQYGAANLIEHVADYAQRMVDICELFHEDDGR